MKLSIWSSYYMDLSPEEMVLELEKQGLQYCELSDEHAAELLERGDPREVGAAFRQFAEAHHVEFSQGHLWLKVRLCRDSEHTVAILKNWFDMFEAIGIKTAVLHTDGMGDTNLTVDEKFAANAAVIRQLTDYLKGRELIICLENLTTKGLNDSADSLLRFIHEIDSPNLAICLDTGHLNLCEDKDQGAFIRKAGKYLKALHIADNEGQADQHMMPYGKGNVDWPTVWAEVKAIGYDGIFNYEIPGERTAPLEIRGYKVEYIRKVFEYMCRK